MKEMKNRIANIARAIRNSRKAKVFASIGALWVALLVGFVVASWTAAKPHPVVVVNPQSSLFGPRIVRVSTMLGLQP